MVQVLISTYNGEKYLREQIDSILGQTYRDIRILIRDDGSQDGTLLILEEYKKRYANVDYYAGENLGVQKSFYDLFSRVAEDVQYIATCDQDDVWYPDKIETAVNRLEDIAEPALYCCRTQLTDANLVPLEDTIRNYVPRLSFGNALIENVCTGCTMVINRALYQKVRGKWPQKSLIHDWWFYQIAMCFGRVVYDDVPHVFYRQHGNNAIGLDHNRLALMKRQVQSLKRFRGTYTAQVQEILQSFSLEGENRYLAELMAGTRDSWRCRWKILSEKRIYRQGRFDTFLFKGMLFLGML